MSWFIAFANRRSLIRSSFKDIKFGFSLSVCFAIRSDGIAFILVIYQQLYMISLPGRQLSSEGKGIYSIRKRNVF